MEVGITRLWSGEGVGSDRIHDHSSAGYLDACGLAATGGYSDAWLEAQLGGRRASKLDPHTDHVNTCLSEGLDNCVVLLHELRSLRYRTLVWRFSRFASKREHAVTFKSMDGAVVA